ncbi:MAG: hypothetical protein Tp1102MES731781_34 [Prokaryotic dsDNA virus sp.]|jgi:hypothetical protein|nr:MAG: hypothetical protein Tp1102MES731781_34 [Prokaryotic dsDNA virus sp.]|tara:strand:+ start:11390 stop:11587 length:198 start_codon:yes stop_codon:yes gene_type:complete
MTQQYAQDLISFQDRMKLRKIVKKVHFSHYPKELITDKEADMFIESLLPETIYKLIKAGTDSNTV